MTTVTAEFGDCCYDNIVTAEFTVRIEIANLHPGVLYQKPGLLWVLL